MAENENSLSEACNLVLIANATGNERIQVDAINKLLDASRQAATELEALRKRCEAVEADAARLDWLEEKCVKVADYYGTGSQLYFGTYASAPLRGAIDQAIAAAQEPSHG